MDLVAQEKYLPIVRVTKNPLKVKDKVKYRLSGSET